MTYVQQFTIELEGNLSLSCIELGCIWLHTVICFNEQGLVSKQKYPLLLTCWKHWRYYNLVNPTDLKMCSSFCQRCKVSRNNSSPFNITSGGWVGGEGHVISRYNVVKARTGKWQSLTLSKDSNSHILSIKHNCHCHSVLTLVSAD